MDDGLNALWIKLFLFSKNGKLSRESEAMTPLTGLTSSVLTA